MRTPLTAEMCIRDRDNAFGDILVEDYNLRKTLLKQLYAAGVPKIEIERDAARVRIHIHCAKPGMVIGRGGSEIEKLRAQCEKMLGKPVVINIIEIKNPDMNAQLVAQNIASQLERRISFRRAMKQSIGRTMRFGAKGINCLLYTSVLSLRVNASTSSTERSAPVKQERSGRMIYP